MDTSFQIKYNKTLQNSILSYATKNSIVNLSRRIILYFSVIFKKKTYLNNICVLRFSRHLSNYATSCWYVRHRRQVCGAKVAEPEEQPPLVYILNQHPSHIYKRPGAAQKIFTIYTMYEGSAAAMCVCGVPFVCIILRSSLFIDTHTHMWWFYLNMRDILARSSVVFAD